MKVSFAEKELFYIKESLTNFKERSYFKVTWTSQNSVDRIKKTFSKKKNFMVPFYGWGSTASRLEPF